jgi:protein-tyrosine-phosphatase
MVNRKLNILFVCKYNRFRSRVAEAYFKKINKNKNIRAESAGIIKGWTPLDKNEVETAREFGLDIMGEPRTLSTVLLKNQNKIIIVANNVPVSLFNDVAIADNYFRKFNKEKKVVLLKVKDESGGNKENIRKIIKSIITKVNKLVKDLEVKK